MWCPAIGRVGGSFLLVSGSDWSAAAMIIGVMSFYWSSWDGYWLAGGSHDGVGDWPCWAFCWLAGIEIWFVSGSRAWGSAIGRVGGLLLVSGSHDGGILDDSKRYVGWCIRPRGDWS